jgi:hypothetical protein
MYEKAGSRYFEWREDENGNLTEPEVIRWMQEENNFRKSQGWDPLFISDSETPELSS